jgi:hypothetical protein
VVVERDTAQWQQELSSLHAEAFGSAGMEPSEAIRLEVIDRATDEAIQRLMAAGLISKTTRATRPLFPKESVAAAPLTAEEQLQAKGHRERAARSLKIARVLGNAGFADETRVPLLDAIRGLGCALAVERRLPEAPELKGVLQPPLSSAWGDALPIVRAFIADPVAAWQPVADRLANLAAVAA